MRERLTGYREALARRRARGGSRRSIASGNHDAVAAQAAVERLLALPDATPADRDLRRQQPQHGRRAARARRSRAPVALVGFDDFELADLLGTTVVRADPWRLGEQAAALAFARLDGDDRPPLEITVPTELIVRGSGEVAP